MNITPAMQQYYDIKQAYSDAILFFRMGDFYEMFEEDAKIAHKILGISLTSRNKNAEIPILLAGIPYHAKEKYIPLLIEAGYKIAIAEQVSDPKLKGIVQREVVRVITPATVLLESDEYENIKTSPVIVSLVSDGEKYGLSMIHLAEQIWKCSEFESFESCAGELYKIAPSEVVLEKQLLGNEKIHEILSKKYGLNIYYYDFQENPYTYLSQKFEVKNLESYGIEHKKYAQKASAMILKYISENQKSEIKIMQKLSYESYSGFMDLDESTIRSLDLIYNIATKSSSIGTLFGVLDETKTPMGKRYLREQILHPLQNVKEIELRQKYISALKADTILLETIRKELNYISDIDAIISRLSLERAGPRDLLHLKKSLVAIRNVLNLVEKSDNNELKKILL